MRFTVLLFLPLVGLQFWCGAHFWSRRWWRQWPLLRCARCLRPARRRRRLPRGAHLAHIALAADAHSFGQAVFGQRGGCIGADAAEDAAAVAAMMTPPKGREWRLAGHAARRLAIGYPGRRRHGGCCCSRCACRYCRRGANGRIAVEPPPTATARTYGRIVLRAGARGGGARG